MRVVAITGASGFVGAHLAESLRDEGARVRAIVDGTPKRVNVCTRCLKAGKVVKK